MTIGPFEPVISHELAESNKAQLALSYIDRAITQIENEIENMKSILNRTIEDAISLSHDELDLQVQLAIFKEDKLLVLAGNEEYISIYSELETRYISRN